MSRETGAMDCFENTFNLIHVPVAGAPRLPGSPPDSY